MRNFIIFLALLGLLIALLNHQFPGALEREGSGYHLLYATLLLVFVGSGVILSARSHWRQHVKHAIAWLAIFLVIMIGYTYRGLILDSKLAAELIPGRTTISEGGSISLRARANGHFYVNARIDGEKVLFLIDTGASDIMLTRETAARIGLIVPPGAKKRIYSTASGTSSGLAVSIERMRIGNIMLRNITAYVSQGDASTNLLGQSFLNQLSGYRVEDGQMTLVP